MPTASITKKIPCSKKNLIKLVLDIEKYPQFVPFCLDARVHERNQKDNSILIIADLTIGQYLQPSVKHHPLDRYYHPNEFKDLEDIAKSKGFLMVSSSPLTRSSYHADEDFIKIKKLRENQSQCHQLQ